ncbi:MAG: hypothetical protein ACI88A_004360 [Paraglaciecola sp.]|jgi:hypothetical protein
MSVSAASKFGQILKPALCARNITKLYRTGDV